MTIGMKSTVEEIRARFDHDVERFSNLETGQQTTVDSPLCMELVTDAARHTNPTAKSLLDIGCGAGNYTLRMLSKLPALHCTLTDLSMPMLQRAKERVSKVATGNIEIIQEDIRYAKLKDEEYDIVLAASVLHHLRGDEDWELVFRKVYKALKPGGSFWIFDLVDHESESLKNLFHERYGDYLTSLGGREFKEKVFAYIEKEDTPRSVSYQTSLMVQTGFKKVEILHKNLCFAAFGGIK